MKVLYLIAVILPSYCHLEDWVDPNDPSSRKILGSPTPDFCQAGTPSCADDPSLRLILRRIFQKIGIDPSQKVYFSKMARLSLSSYNMAIIADYLETETEEISQRELVRSALHNMIELLPEDNTTLMDSIITFLWPWIVIFNFIILPPAAFFVLRNIMSTRSFWLSLLSIIILLSMVTTYNRMYQEKIAARIAAATEIKDDACATAGLIEQGLDFLRGFVLLKRKSPCLKFIEAQTISIVSEISLLDVFSDVLSNGLFGWLSSLGPHLNKFYRGLCEGIPLPMQILMFISMFFLFVRIKTPLFTIEPMRNVCSTAIHGLTKNDQTPERQTTFLPGKDPVAAIGERKGDKFHNITQRTPERIRRLMERKRREKIALKGKEESDSDKASISSANEFDTSHSRSISRGRYDDS